MKGYLTHPGSPMCHWFSPVMFGGDSSPKYQSWIPKLPLDRRNSPKPHPVDIVTIAGMFHTFRAVPSSNPKLPKLVVKLVKCTAKSGWKTLRSPAKTRIAHRCYRCMPPKEDRSKSWWEDMGKTMGKPSSRCWSLTRCDSAIRHDQCLWQGTAMAEILGALAIGGAKGHEKMGIHRHVIGI